MTEKKKGRGRKSRKKSSLDRLSKRVARSVDELFRITSRTKRAWKNHGLVGLSIPGAIFLRVASATIATAPTVVDSRLALRSLRKGPKAVAVLATTASLRDRDTRKILTPGIYLVLLRLDKRRYLLDFVDSSGRVGVSVKALASSEEESPDLISAWAEISRGDEEWKLLACLNFLGKKNCWEVEFPPSDGAPDPGWEGWDPENPGSIE